jgi:hypothetical protein
VVNGTTITSRIPSELRHHCSSTFQYNERSQLQHLQKIHMWTKAQLESVAWDVFHAATNQKASFGHQHFLLRWANHILPLMERQHCWGLAASGECPSACGCNEDEPHLLRCPHPARQTPRTSLYQSLVATFRPHHADPWLRQILLSFLALCDPSVTYNLDALTEPYRRLLEHQSALGAESLAYGHFHQSWVSIQQNYLRSQDLPCDRRQATTLVTKWAQLFQKSARDQWEVRNGHLHDSIEDQNPHADTLLRLTVKQLYEDMDSLPAKDQEAVFGDITLEDRLVLPPIQLRDWILFAKPVISYIKKHAHQDNTDIRDFFLPQQPHPAPPGRPPGRPHPQQCIIDRCNVEL